MIEKDGLTDKEVVESRKKYGTNGLGEYKKNSFLKLIFESLADPIIRILLIALAVKTIFLFRSFDWYETIGILVAIFTASFISSISEYGSDKAFNNLMNEVSNIKCKVIRNGKKKEIYLNEVVVNDIVILESGDMIPADGILISGKVAIDESNLNGESRIIEKNIDNELLRGSVVMSGQAYMKVDKVGIETFYGRLASELKVKQPISPLKKRLISLAKTVSIIGYIGSIFVFFSYIIINGINISNIIYALTLAVTIIIVCVPEGLPMMLTLVLSSNMKRMLKDNVLVRKLMGIETSGCINILFTDKTGTLTKGELEVTKFVDGNLKEYSYTDLIKSNLSRIVKISCTVNNTSSFDKDKIIGGNITDKAILKYIKPNNISYHKEKVIPFDSNNKYMVTTIFDKERINLIKGAPEVLIDYLKNYYTELNSKEKINISKLKSYIDNKTSCGFRVIMLATSNNITPENFNNLSLVGLLLIRDDIRDNVIEGLDLVNKAHIQTVMLTGDNIHTAKSIAAEIGLYKEGDIALTSEELSNMTDNEIKEIIPKIRIIARMLPHDKSRLVRICQEMDLVVGMTGDGVNDAPALKRADVGFSMGSGTEVAKEASDIVILDNNFLSISKAILYGRTIFKSIRKFIILQLTINLCALSLSILGPFIGVSSPVTVIQMLWINMVMDTLAGIAFAYEPPVKEYMYEKPKNKNEQIINKYMISQILLMGIVGSLLCFCFLKLPFFMHIYKDNNTLLTAFFGLFIFIDIFNSFNSRTNHINLLFNIKNNKIFIMIIIFIAIVQILMIYYGGNIFRTNGLSFNQLFITIMYSSLVIPIDLLRKIFLKRKKINIGV